MFSAHSFFLYLGEIHPPPKGGGLFSRGDKLLWFFSKQRREEKRHPPHPPTYTRPKCPCETVEIYTFGDGTQTESVHCWKYEKYPVVCWCYTQLCPFAQSRLSSPSPLAQSSDVTTNIE